MIPPQKNENNQLFYFFSVFLLLFLKVTLKLGMCPFLPYNKQAKKKKAQHFVVQVSELYVLYFSATYFSR